MRFSVVLLYIIVLLSSVLSRTSCSSLNFIRDQSICSEGITKFVTKFVPYEETYRYLNFFNEFPFRRSRINYRRTYEIVTTTQEVCCEGYERIMGKCISMCSTSCINSKCIEVEVCQCFPGYRQISHNACEPVCSNGCLNGRCTQPELCSCFSNYSLGTNNFTCHPNCDKNCELNNGHCLEPHTCVCNNGYKKSNESNICEPFCENECSNGTCIAPDTCKCDEGFILQEDNVTAAVCKPFCSSPCGPNAECIGPDLCICKEGYRALEKNDTTNDVSVVLDSKNTTCIPICENDCVNGKCVSSNICVCDDGYSIDLANTTNYRHGNYCQSICENSCTPNVKCDGPDDCACDKDNHNITTSNDKQVCQPICEIDCENGMCTSPNVCTCYKGYEQDEKGRCEPVCYPLCVNGTCIAPNTCQCNEDFVEMKSDNVSTCVPQYSRNCSDHGTWSNELNTCLCFYGWTGWNCDEASVCVYKTRLDSPLLSSVTVINETNSTLMDSYDNAPLCYQCSDSLDNKTLCLAVQSDESLTIPTVGCFLSTELPCYRRPRHNAFKKSSHMTVSLIGVTIAIIVIGVVAGYAIIRKRQKRKEISVNVQTIFLKKEEMEDLIAS